MLPISEPDFPTALSATSCACASSLSLSCVSLLVVVVASFVKSFSLYLDLPRNRRQGLYTVLENEEGFTLNAAQDDIAFTTILLFVLQHISQFRIADFRQKTRPNLAA